MDWMVLCPLCSSIIESFGSLRTINANHYHCHFCQSDHDATLDDYIVIAFTIAPRIRAIAFHQPETLAPMDYLSHFRGQTCGATFQKARIAYRPSIFSSNA
jgi:hypothetical protein